jgi:hypothetical protein
MAEVTGPISTLPNSRHTPPKGAKCDDHPDRDAVVRIQGETDSFGSEMHDMCEECLAADRAWHNSPEAAEWRKGQCEWCRNEATDLRDARDYEEGMSGRVYRVCGACIRQQNEEIERDLAAYDSHYYDDPPCPTCKGRGTVNPITAPKGFFCVGSVDCPTCDGTGDCP